MDRLGALATFKAVVDYGSFRRAADGLDVSCAKVSRTVLELEALLGAQLLQRSSRRVSLTSVGQEVLQRATDLLDAYQALADWSSRNAREATGTVRVGAPAAFARSLLAPALAGFMSGHPGVCVDLRARDRTADVFDDEVDLLLLLRQDLRPGLVARRIGEVELGVYAAPAYLAGRPEPLEPDALLSHNCLSCDELGSRTGWHLSRRGDGLSRELPVKGTMRCSHADVLLETTLHGAGIALLPQFMAEKFVARGACRRLLPAWSGQPLPIYLAWGSRRHLPLAVRALIDHLAGALGAASRDTARAPHLRAA